MSTSSPSSPMAASLTTRSTSVSDTTPASSPLLIDHPQPVHVVRLRLLDRLSERALRRARHHLPPLLSISGGGWDVAVSCARAAGLVRGHLLLLLRHADPQPRPQLRHRPGSRGGPSLITCRPPSSLDDLRVDGDGVDRRRTHRPDGLDHLAVARDGEHGLVHRAEVAPGSRQDALQLAAVRAQEAHHVHLRQRHHPVPRRPAPTRVLDELHRHDVVRRALQRHQRSGYPLAERLHAIHIPSHLQFTIHKSK
ncbi:hypothetical protein GUJ93_ZPchr0002g23695 [Zizania palustris]|uniref:Uncharacterized protein n=1 Tax=Zizania palustris TaxID=103762 RepID=A0A8J5VFP6_ZIZPA|nr:hypothetical protein GUJ93_ZPchr0402g33737 [Zizania palustris]KAG8058156.1 hypothetical protein GUJ93_ZPchr0002g23695 [Zizania palustris]